MLLLFKPVFRLEHDVIQRRSLIFLLDTSASMATADDPQRASRGSTRPAAAIHDWWGELAKDFDLHLIEFSDHATPLDRASDLAPAAADRRSDLADPGLVGRGHTPSPATSRPSSSSPTASTTRRATRSATARKLGAGRPHGRGRQQPPRQPLVSRRPGDRPGMPEQFPVNNRARLTAHVGQVGLAGEVVKVTLEEDGKPIDRSNWS